MALLICARRDILTAYRVSEKCLIMFSAVPLGEMMPQFPKGFWLFLMSLGVNRELFALNL